jgi:hypothetical protein
MSTLKLTNIVSQQGTGDPVISLGTNDQVTFTNPISQPGAFMFRNKIINGNFDVWQRATSQTSSGYGSADRWTCFHDGSTKTVSRQTFALGQTDVPNNPKYFMRHVVTSVTGAGNYVIMDQRIEGVETLSGKTITLSFWARADSSKNIAVEFQQNFGTGGSPSTSVFGIGSQVVALTTSWTKYTVTVDIPSVSGKTLGTDSNDNMRIRFWFDAGSNYNAVAAFLGQQSGTFDLAQIQIEEGSVATPFEQRPIGTELIMCQRYYQKSYNQDRAPGTASSESGGIQSAPSGTSTTYFNFGPIQYVTTMRGVPTVTIYNPTTGSTTNPIRNISLSTNLPGSPGSIGDTRFNLFVNNSNVNQNNLVMLHYTADAEL